MKTIKKILYATDFSESSVPACDYALTLANLAKAELHVLHVIGEFADRRFTMVQPEAMALLEREVKDHAVLEMTDFCAERFQGKVNFTSDVVMGVPVQEILKSAESLPADLIVIGTHGRSGLQHALVGSTAERLVRRSKIPVLTVRSKV